MHEKEEVGSFSNATLLGFGQFESLWGHNNGTLSLTQALSHSCDFKNLQKGLMQCEKDVLEMNGNVTNLTLQWNHWK